MCEETLDGAAAVREMEDDFGSVRTFFQAGDCAGVDADVGAGTEVLYEGVAKGFGAICVDGYAVGGKLVSVAGKVHCG